MAVKPDGRLVRRRGGTGWRVRGGGLPERGPWALVKPHRAKLAALGASSILGGLAEATLLVIVTRVALAISAGRSTVGLMAGWYVPLRAGLLIAVGILATRLILAMVSVRASTLLSAVVCADLRQRLTSAYLTTSWATKQNEPAGSLQQLLLGLVGGALGVVSSASAILGSGLNLSALVLVSVAVDPKSTVFVMLALLAVGSMLAPIRRRIRLRSKAATDASVAFNETVSEFSMLGLEMEAYGVRDAFADRLGRQSDREIGMRKRSESLRSMLAPMYTSLAYFALVLGLGVVASTGQAQLSSVGAVMLVMVRSLSYGQQLQVAVGGLAASSPVLERIHAALDRFGRDRAPGGQVQLTRLGPIEARGVSFHYDEREPVLTDVSFRIEAGEIVGVIGASGAGKSTLIQLLLGIRSPTAGTILIDGVDLADVAREDWCRFTAFVAQDANLLSSTVSDNVRFFRTGISDADITEALASANITTEVLDLPEGLNTHLGARGSRLSGGQRQRLSIARAFAGKPQLIILDEPTSSLDVASEALVRDSVAALRSSGTTAVIIAHRMSTLDICDRIMVIEAGRVAAFAAPSDLRDSNDFYNRAIELSGLK